jgi:stress response protein SCP2
LSGGSGNDVIVVYDGRDDNQAVTVTDYDGAHDTLQLGVNEVVADLADWTLFAQTDTATGTVTLGLENNADPTQTIDLARLQSPVNFALTQVSVYQ